MSTFYDVNAVDPDPAKADRFVTDDRGSSAIEFALLAPMLLVALLGTVDVGRALTERLAMGSLLRIGAQSAIAGGGPLAVEETLRVAASENFRLATLEAPDDEASLALQVTRICACPDNAHAPVDCSITCVGPAPTHIYYTLAAEKNFSGIFLPDVRLSKSLQVQLR